MAKNAVWFLAIIVVGALLGSFLGKFIVIVAPEGSIKDLFATDISAGLSPATLDLRVIELTFGCLLRLNITAVLGIVIAALLFKKVMK
ncbi:MAG: hypothetical protein A2293_09550 [Elusimicrobia bacterium RIFOXYB2_FULL_49_7]|nr:MAG: hypothetical protein A2293_09550 [Elusimicrobia bacterium RIFOXYB2_FULL_49_7]